jgi:hypothetical protein
MNAPPNEVASQSETFSKRVGQKQNRNRTGLLARPADGRTPDLFSIDRPPLLAVMRVRAAEALCVIRAVREGSEVQPHTGPHRTVASS